MYKFLFGMLLACSAGILLIDHGCRELTYTNTFYRSANAIRSGDVAGAQTALEELKGFGHARNDKIEFNRAQMHTIDAAWEDARDVLEKLAVDTKDPDLRADALYNLSLVYIELARIESSEARQQAAMKAAIESLKEALRTKPDHWNAKWNYEVLMQQIERQGGGQGNGKGKPKPGGNESGDPNEGREAGKNPRDPKL